MRFLLLLPALLLACDAGDPGIEHSPHVNPENLPLPTASTNPELGPADACVGFYAFGHPIEQLRALVGPVEGSVAPTDTTFVATVTDVSRNFSTGELFNFWVQADDKRCPGIYLGMDYFAGTWLPNDITFIDGYSESLLASGDRVELVVAQVANNNNAEEIRSTTIRRIATGTATPYLLEDCPLSGDLEGLYVQITGRIASIQAPSGSCPTPRTFLVEYGSGNWVAQLYTSCFGGNQSFMTVGTMIRITGVITQFNSDFQINQQTGDLIVQA